MVALLGMIVIVAIAALMMPLIGRLIRRVAIAMSLAGLSGLVAGLTAAYLLDGAVLGGGLLGAMTAFLLFPIFLFAPRRPRHQLTVDAALEPTGGDPWRQCWAGAEAAPETRSRVQAARRDCDRLLQHVATHRGDVAAAEYAEAIRIRVPQVIAEHLAACAAATPVEQRATREHLAQCLEHFAEASENHRKRAQSLVNRNLDTLRRYAETRATESRG